MLNSGSLGNDLGAQRQFATNALAGGGTVPPMGGNDRAKVDGGAFASITPIVDLGLGQI